MFSIESFPNCKVVKTLTFCHVAKQRSLPAAIFSSIDVPAHITCAASEWCKAFRRNFYHQGTSSASIGFKCNIIAPLRTRIKLILLQRASLSPNASPCVGKAICVSSSPPWSVMSILKHFVIVVIALYASLATLNKFVNFAKWGWKCPHSPKWVTLYYKGWFV